MSEPTQQRVARPSSDAEFPGVSSPVGVSRNTLTFWLSVTAIFLSIVSAGVNFYVFKAIGERKATNEADEIHLKAEANRVLREMTDDPQSHVRLRGELTRLYKTLIYRPSFDAPLTVYERAAFGLVVAEYAGPMAEVQLKTIDARELMNKEVPTTVNGRNLTWAEIYCITDPYGVGCPKITGVNDEPLDNDPVKK